MAFVVSVINSKGGVGKTMVSVTLAEYLSAGAGKKTLVVDLDPQSSATFMLIGMEKWFTLNKRNKTIYNVFLDALLETNYYHIKDAVIEGVSNVGGGIGKLDLLPASIEVNYLQDKLFQVKNPTTIIYDALLPLIPDYDFVIIDCPPNLGLVTQNGLYFSDYYLVPCIPDILSVYGIPQIQHRIEMMKNPVRGDSVKGTLAPLGVVITKYREDNPLHKGITKLLRQKNLLGRVFKTMVADSVHISKAADYLRKTDSLENKYGPDHDNMKRLTGEFYHYVKSQNPS